jgi:hypothetical protein
MNYRLVAEYEKLDAEDAALLDRFARLCDNGWIVDPDGRGDLFPDAATALLEIDWLLDATPIADYYPEEEA